jgi:hypothetical protein
MTSSLEPPTLSEVIRRLDELKTDVKDLGGRVVSTDLYVAEKQQHDREMKELRERITTVEQESDEREKRSQDQASKNRQFLIGLIVSPFASALIAWIIAGGIRP